MSGTKDTLMLDWLERAALSGDPSGVCIGRHGDGNLYVNTDTSRVNHPPRRATLREAIAAVMSTTNEANHE